MYIHGNNETDKTINVSKIANTSTLDDNSTAAGCNSRLMIIHWRTLCYLRLPCRFDVILTLYSVYFRTYRVTQNKIPHRKICNISEPVA